MANLIDGFNQVRASHRAQQQHDRRLPIEDQASASVAAAPSVPDSNSASTAAAPAPKGSSSAKGSASVTPKSKSTPTAPRGRRAQGNSSKGNNTKELNTTDGEREREVAGQGCYA